MRYAIGTIEGTVPDLFMAAPGLVGAEIEKRGRRRSDGHRFWVPLATSSR